MPGKIWKTEEKNGSYGKYKGNMQRLQQFETWLKERLKKNTGKHRKHTEKKYGLHVSPPGAPPDPPPTLGGGLPRLKRERRVEGGTPAGWRVPRTPPPPPWGTGLQVPLENLCAASTGFGDF